MVQGKDIKGAAARVDFLQKLRIRETAVLQQNKALINQNNTDMVVKMD